MVGLARVQLGKLFQALIIHVQKSISLNHNDIYC